MGIWSIKSLRASCYSHDSHDSHVWDYFLMPYKFHIILSNYRQVTKAIKAAKIPCKKGRALALVYSIIYFILFEHVHIHECVSASASVKGREREYVYNVYVYIYLYMKELNKTIIDWWATEYVMCVFLSLLLFICVFSFMRQL